MNYLSANYKISKLDSIGELSANIKRLTRVVAKIETHRVLKECEMCLNVSELMYCSFGACEIDLGKL